MICAVVLPAEYHVHKSESSENYITTSEIVIVSTIS